MRVGVYSPYLDTLGGGEKYMMTIAEVLSGEGDEVEVLLDKHLTSAGGDFLKKKLSDRFNLNLDKVSFLKAPIGKGSNFFERLIFLRIYDVLFYLTDGSIFLSTAKKNILHIQSPLAGQPTKSLWGRIKLNFWNLIIYNSQFTKRYSKNNWPLFSKVLYPPVDIDKIKPLKKKNYILSVGRFFGYLKDKKHQVLIESFRELFKSGKIKDWSLCLAGSAGQGDKEYLEQLKKSAKDLPVIFFPNISYDELMTLYGQSGVYWHASGFEEVDPAKMEHFGIATVEAMAAGAVPVVINKGGQTEIVEDNKSGLLWDDLEQMQRLTLKIINDTALRDNLSKNAILRAPDFSKEAFAKEVINLVRK